jgi:hypothetical protein
MAFQGEKLLALFAKTVLQAAEFYRARLPDEKEKGQDHSKFSGASLVTVWDPRAETPERGHVKKASTPTRIEREDYVPTEEVNETIRKY